jgi:hypothetical protein
MMVSIMRWLRRMLPPLWLVFLAIGFFMVMEGMYFWLRYYIIDLQTSAEISQQFIKIRDGSVTAMMVLYGAFRVAAFHPLFQPKYRAWLRQTPWTWRKSLPLGPIHLVWIDAIVLGVVLLLLHGSIQGRVWIVEAFFFAYLGVLGYSFWRTGPR